MKKKKSELEKTKKSISFAVLIMINLEILQNYLNIVTYWKNEFLVKNYLVFKVIRENCLKVEKIQTVLSSHIPFY